MGSWERSDSVPLWMCDELCLRLNKLLLVVHHPLTTVMGTGKILEQEFTVFVWLFFLIIKRSGLDMPRTGRQMRLSPGGPALRSASQREALQAPLAAGPLTAASRSPSRAAAAPPRPGRGRPWPGGDLRSSPAIPPELRSPTAGCGGSSPPRSGLRPGGCGREWSCVSCEHGEISRTFPSIHPSYVRC